MADDSARRKGLGRGLSALLGDNVEAAPAAAPRPKPTGTLPIEFLRPSRLQPRRDFSPESLEELSNSIREVGIVQPIVVRPTAEPNVYEIVAGERRWRAAQRVPLHEVPVLLRDLTDRETLEIAIVENVQRKDLNAVEEGEAYKRLMEEFGYTQDAVADVVGKSRSHVANTLRLLGLPSRVREWIREGKLTAGHARAALRTADPERFAERMIEGEMSVREAEAAAPAKGPHAARAPKAPDPNTAALERSLTESLGFKVSVHDRNGRGTVQISYQSLDQLQALCERLTQSVTVTNDNRPPEDPL
ncbi:ParB/RepB/Spo0J family partition protein [Desertibaculum subflavum]|uniref:ParB/RepB/Spo0J family partition protein n=1 Tax=Desertibaculum subflavum TaxID=2268458 RepID=UPI000E66EEA7